MCNYISAFVKTGDPNCNDNDGTPQTEWKTYTKEQKGGLNFTGEGSIAI
jgi:para-nitrobenzyl esterase